MNRNKPISSCSLFVTFLRTTVTTRSVKMGKFRPLSILIIQLIKCANLVVPSPCETRPYKLWYPAHLGTESEHQVLGEDLNIGKLNNLPCLKYLGTRGGYVHEILVFFTRIVLLLFGAKFQYSRKGDNMKRENNPIMLPLETWCSLSVPQCAVSNKRN